MAFDQPKVMATAIGSVLLVLAAAFGVGYLARGADGAARDQGQADSAGGVIVTDWYTNPSNPTERVKLTVTILDQDLRADALRVAASRQVNEGGNWVEAPVQAATVQKLEDIILTKARDLRRQALAS